MNVIFLTQGFPPETHAGSNRAEALADALARRTSLTVVTPHPSVPHQHHYSPEDVASADGRKSFRIVRSTTLTVKRGSYIRRSLQEATMVAHMVTRRLPRPDIVVATSPSFYVGPIGLTYAKVRRSAIAWDVRDVTWEYARQALAADEIVGRLRRLAVPALERAARTMARRADHVFASNPMIADSCEQLGARSVTHASNGISEELFDALAGVASTRPPDDPIRVTYAGAIGGFQSLDVLLDVAAEMPFVQFTIAGEGAERERLRSAASLRGLTNVELPGYLGRSDLLELYAQSHLLFAHLKDLEVMSRATVPSKIYEYLAAGRPVVYAGAGLAADIITQSGGGIVAEPMSSRSITKAIEEAMSDPDQWDRMATNGRAFAATHLRHEIMDRAVEDLLARIS